MKKNQKNPVAKNLRKFNKSVIMIDQKKELKKVGTSKNQKLCDLKDDYGNY